jgi:hypothetical protein
MQIDHFSTITPTPNIDLFPDDKAIPNVQLAKTDASWTLSSGALTANITENPYTITFKAGNKTLTSAGYKHQASFFSMGTTRV